MRRTMIYNIRLIPLLVVLLCVVATDCFSQDDIHPIDLSYKQCLEVDSNYTMVGTVECINRAWVEWEIEMNHYYTLLADTLSTETAEILKKSQDTWVDHFENECDFINLFYHLEMNERNFDERAEFGLYMVRERALKLRKQYEYLIEY